MVASRIEDSDIDPSEGPTTFLSNQHEGVYHLFVDDLSPRGYVPYETVNNIWSVDAVQNYSLPTNPRHGTVFGISAQEMENLASL